MVTDVINALQGLSIFLVFVCSRTTLRKVRMFGLLFLLYHLLYTVFFYNFLHKFCSKTSRQTIGFLDTFE